MLIADFNMGLSTVRDDIIGNNNLPMLPWFKGNHSP
jgi:hypothetical protein